MSSQPQAAPQPASAETRPRRRVSYASHGDPPLTDTDVQRLEREAVSRLLRRHFRDQPQVYVSADLFVYYEEGAPGKRVAPDVFVCFGVPARLRTTYMLWEEGHGIDWALEIVSKGTWKKDLQAKREIYEARLGTQEYFVYDPEGKYLDDPLVGFHRVRGRLVRMRAGAGRRLHSRLLGLDLGLVPVQGSPIARWELHLYGPDGQRLLREEEARDHAEREVARAEQERARAEQERARAERERAQAEERARRLERELERLRRRGRE
jgi:Uma2 family endonuclease